MILIDGGFNNNDRIQTSSSLSLLSSVQVQSEYHHQEDVIAVLHQLLSD